MSRAPEITALVASILDLARTLRAEDGDDDVEDGPAGPATAAAIDAVEQARGFPLPPAYRDFLSLHDGWPDFIPGISLTSTAALASSSYDRGYLDEADDVAEELLAALAIGTSDNDATLVLLLPDGAVVDWLYEEHDRHVDMVAFLAARRDVLQSCLDGGRRTRAAIAAEWTAPVRAGREAALADELRALLADAGPVAPPPAPLVALPDPPPRLEVGDLIVAAADDAGSARATLTLVLYLGAAPSPDELRRAYRAFRTRFPVAGQLGWEAAATYSFGLPTVQDEPDDDAFLDGIRVDAGGHFGLRAMVTSGGDAAAGGAEYIFNLRHVPPGDGDPPQPRAGFAEIIVPVDADADAVAALAADLLAILPVRSGHAGYSVLMIGDDDAVGREVFAWTRRCFGLDVCRVDGWLPATLTRLRGAAWLTILGPTFAAALADRLPASADVAITRSEHGAILRAGAAPSLGDVARGELPPGVAEVARALAPVTVAGGVSRPPCAMTGESAVRGGVAGYHEVGAMRVAGNAFITVRDELPPFTGHHATTAFMRRFLDPAGWQGPTPREQGEALLAAVATGDGVRWWTQWQGEDKDGWRAFPTLLRLLYNASCADICADASIAALELAAQHDDGLVERVMNNLLVGYHKRGQLAAAVALLPRALTYADRNPYILHTAACICAVTGDPERALALATQARDVGYEHLGQMRADEDLRVLWDRPEFQALFA